MIRGKREAQRERQPVVYISASFSRTDARIGVTYIRGGGTAAENTRATADPRFAIRTRVTNCLISGRSGATAAVANTDARGRSFEGLGKLPASCATSFPVRTFPLKKRTRASAFFLNLSLVFFFSRGFRAYYARHVLLHQMDFSPINGYHVFNILCPTFATRFRRSRRGEVIIIIMAESFV